MATGAIPAQIVFEHQEKDKTDIYDDEISMVPLYDQPDSYYHTCCGKVHVEKAAIWIAILAFLFHHTAVFHDTYSRMFHMPTHYYVYNVYNATVPIPLTLVAQGSITSLLLFFYAIASYVCILVAQKRNIARLYQPFLVYNGLMLAGVGITVAMVIKFYLVSGSSKTFVILASALAQLLLFSWMELIVYKAYKYMMNHGNGNNNRMMHFDNPMYFDDSMKV